MEKKNIFAKFSLKWALGAMLIAGALLTGCKDDTDELEKRLDDLQKKIDLILAGGVVSEVTQNADGGYTITYEDGSTKSINGVTIVQNSDGSYTLSAPGIPSVRIGGGYVGVSSVTFLAEYRDQATGQPIIPFRSLILTGVNADEYDYSGTTTLRYRVTPSRVPASAFEVLGFEASASTLAASGKPMSVIMQGYEYSPEESILTVYASWDKDSYTDAGDALFGGAKQDQLQLVVKNTVGDVKSYSEEVIAVRQSELLIDSAAVYDRTSWTTGTANHQALLFAMDGENTINPNIASTMADPNDLTGMSDYEESSISAGGNPAAVEDFQISTRDQKTVDKVYINSYDLSDSVGVFVYDGTDWTTPMENTGFTPVYHFDTLKMNVADEDAFISVSPAGVITFNSAFNTTTTDYQPGVKVWATLEDGREKLADATIAWGAMKLKFADAAPTIKYTATIADAYSIRTWDNDTIWVGSLAAALEKAGISAAKFADNYAIDAVSSFGVGATLAPLKTISATGDAFDLIVEKGAFGVIVDKGATVFDKYKITMDFIDKEKGSDPDMFGKIQVELTLNVKLPDLNGAWTRTNYLWYDDEVVVDGEPAAADTWEMFAGLTGIYTGESYTNTLKAWPAAASVDSAWVWRAMDGSRLIGDTITWIGGDSINLEYSKHKDYINRSKGIKVAAYAKLLNHGGYAYDGGTKEIGARGTGADSVIQLFAPVDLTFGMPVAPLQKSGVAISLNGVQEGDSVYLLNGLSLNNYIFGRQLGTKQIIKPSDDAKTKPAIIDTVAMAQYQVAGVTGVVDAADKMKAGITYSIPAELKNKLTISDATTGLLKWTGGINVTADETVEIEVTIPNYWNDGTVGNAATKAAVKVKIPVTIKTVRQ